MKPTNELLPEEGFDIINGTEALKRLVDGKMISIGGDVQFKLDFSNGNLLKHDIHGADTVSNITLQNVLKMQWYVKHPFDARKVMREQPDKWVAAYREVDFFEDEHWMKVGFSTDWMSAVAVPFDFEGEIVGSDHDFVRPNSMNLDDCIDINDLHRML